MQNSLYVELFYKDALKSIIEVKSLLIRLKKDQQNINLNRAIFIKLHYLKGHAKGLGFRAIQSMAHTLGDVFSEILKGRIFFSNKEVAKQLTNGIYTLEKLINAIKTGEKIKYLINKTYLGGILSEARSLNDKKL
jgi:chemotaxis protein histidine kinase CheA